MARYYGIIQSVVKRGYDAFQVTFRVHQIHDRKEANTMGNESRGEIHTYRVDVAVEDGRLILFPDRELAQCIKMYYSSSEERMSDTDWKRWREIGHIADRLCRHVSSLLFERDSRVDMSLPA